MKSELLLTFDSECQLIFRKCPKGDWKNIPIEYGCQITGFGGEIAIVVQYVTRQSGYADVMVSATEVDGEIHLMKEHPRTGGVIDTINDMINKMLPREYSRTTRENKVRHHEKGDSEINKEIYAITLTEKQVTGLHIEPRTIERVIDNITKQAINQGYIPVRKIVSKRLTEIKTDLENLISEADGILEETDPELYKAAAKKGMGWINIIRDSLSPGEMNTFSESMIYMEDTIHVLEDSADRGLGLHGRGRS